LADIFISYSKQDQDDARLLAAFLEAEGYSVWWDAGLHSGDNFRKVIMTELGRARAVIAIWTENSVHSDWVASEAGRAHADRKLIPVKARGVPYRDIPPPFDAMHIENLDSRDKILGAVVAQLAKPEVQTSTLQRVSKVARYELLSWFGIAGAALTLVTNMKGVLTLARWVAQLFDSWTRILSFVWRHVFFFLPKIDAIDSLLLTFLSFAAVNVIMSSTRIAPELARRHSRKSLIAAICLIVGIFWIGWQRLLGRLDMGDYGYYYSLIETLIDMLVAFQISDVGYIPVPKTWVVYAFIFLLFYVLPLLPFAVAFAVAHRWFDFRVNTSVLAGRLWRIVAGVVLLVVLNLVSRLIEQHAWLQL